MDLSTTEAGLLYSIKNEPGKTITYYGDQLRMTSGFLTRPLEKLMRLGYVERNNNKLTISDSFLRKEEQQNVEEVVEIPEPVVEVKAAPAEAVQAVSKEVLEEILKEAAVEAADNASVYPPLTSMELQKLLADGEPRTALAIAVHFGYSRGTSVAQVLRNMCNSNVMVKTGTHYTLKYEPNAVAVGSAGKPEAEAVAEVVVEVAPENLTLNADEMWAAIEKIHQPFTAHECHLLLSRNHKLDHAQFFDMFESAAFDGKLLAWDGNEFVDPSSDYSPSHKFIVPNRLEANESIALMDSYCEKFKGPYKLFEVVSDTRLPPAEVLAYFHDMNYFTRDINNINHGNFAPYYPNRKERQSLKKGSGAKPYARLETLEQENVKRFMLGGVAVDTFIKRFNLDPSEKARLIEVLVASKLARHEAENDWIFLSDDVELKQLKLGDAEIEDDEPCGRCGKNHGPEPSQEELLENSLDKIMEAEDALIKEFALKSTKDGADFEFQPDEIGIGTEIPSDIFGKLVDSFVGSLPSAPGNPAVMSRGMCILSRAEYDKVKAEGADVTLVEEVPNSDKVYVWVGQDQPVDNASSVDIGNDHFMDEDDGPIACETCDHHCCVCAEEERDSCFGCGAGPDDECTCKQFAENSASPEHVPYVYGAAGQSGVSGQKFSSEAPDQKWLLTLQMLEERMRFEHQYTQANQLKEIREYLETK